MEPTKSTMRCSQILNGGRGHTCKRNACDNSDFCKQHNPLNKLDDTMCAICLDDIKDPVNAGGCRHVFCKDCLTETVLKSSLQCPCCRERMTVPIISKCLRFKLGKKAADVFELESDIALFPEKWERRWSRSMIKRYITVYPEIANMII